MSRSAENTVPNSSLVPDFSLVGYRLFTFYLRRYFARHFTAVRTSRGGAPPVDSKPLIVYANHPSWWDPIHFGLLACHLLPGRRVYGPMDTEALEKYRLFKKLGVFGVDGSRRGAARFLRVSLAVLSQPGSSLWLTAEGEFTDPRRPARIQPGVAHLARRLDHGWVLPLALEYPFWNERHPEALSRFGRPVDLEQEPERSIRDWVTLLEERLRETQQALADEARSRQPECFVTLQAGRMGIGGIYDHWRRLQALTRGESFVAAHGEARR